MTRDEMIIEMREQGIGPRAIARSLKLSPNIIAGVLWRRRKAGGVLPPVPKYNCIAETTVAEMRRLDAEGVKRGAIAAQCGVSPVTVRAYLGHTDRPHAKQIPLDVRARAVALALAGVTARVAAQQCGVSQASIKFWRHDPETRAVAESLAGLMREHAAAQLLSVETARMQRETAAAAERAAINAPLLAELSPRKRAIADLRLAGASLQHIGDQFGCTREYIRQVMARLRGLGLQTEDEAPLSAVALAKFGPKPERPKPGRPAKPKPVLDPFVRAQALLDKPRAPRAPYRITDAERERRRQWGKVLGARRWGAA